jgi:threonine 3-dehydrogenase
MAGTMRALQKTRPEPGLELVELPVPELAEDEVLVRVEATSVCGTDLHIYRWDDWAQRRVRPPLVLGHEFAGTVVEAGRLVRHVQAGDYVSAESHVTCGICHSCRTGRAHMCERTQILGVDRPGAFAEYVAVPESVVWENDRSKLPPEIATLQEPFGNAVFALGHADLAGKTVAILGCGPIGLFGIGIARAFGAVRILASDPHPYRLELAGEMGADAAFDAARAADPVAAFVARNEGEHLDVVFEMSGAPEAIVDAFRIVRHGGRVILFGIPAQPVSLDLAETLIFKNLDVSAVSGRQVWDTWYRTRWLLEHGVVDLRPLITAELGLDQFEQAFAMLERGDACKIVLRPPAVALEAAA